MSTQDQEPGRPGEQLLRRPHFHAGDSLHLLYRMDGMFYLQLSDKRLLACLKTLCGSGRTYAEVLRQYPGVACQPLDPFYLCRRASCTLNEDLLQDLLFSFSWREANWGAWLAALQPRSAYAKHIRRRRPQLPYGQEVTGLALAACGAANLTAGQAEQWELLQQLRTHLALLPPLISPMRFSPTVEQEAAMRADVDAVRQAYRQGGAFAARQVLDQTPFRHWLQDHVAWARSGRHGGG